MMREEEREDEDGKERMGRGTYENEGRVKRKRW
jgi:hypothetical protein